MGVLSGHDATEGSPVQQTSSDEKEIGDTANSVNVLNRTEQSAEGPDEALTNPQLLRKLRIQVRMFMYIIAGWVGWLLTTTLLTKIWAGAVSGFVIALSIGGAFIGVVRLLMYSAEQSIVQWKIKLAHAFQKTTGADQVKGAKTSRYALFLLPFITVLREGLEAVVFASGVS